MERLPEEYTAKRESTQLLHEIDSASVALPGPRFEMDKSGPPHLPIFTATVTLVPLGCKFTGEPSSNKKEAEQPNKKEAAQPNRRSNGKGRCIFLVHGVQEVTRSSVTVATASSWEAWSGTWRSFEVACSTKCSR